MSIEVEQEEATAAQVTVDTPPVKPAPLVKVVSWRRRRYQLGALFVLVLVVAALVANNFLARQYSPDGVVRQYLSALQGGDASSAWGLIQVTPADPAQLSLLDKAALAAALGDSRPDIRSLAITDTKTVDAATAQVNFSYETASGTKQGSFIVQRTGENKVGIYPGWHVVVTPVVLQVNLPPGSGGVSIDGKTLAVAGATHIAVLPVSHRLRFAGTSMVSGQTINVDAFSNAAPTVTYGAALTSAGTARAKAAVAAAFQACAKQVESRPDGCPQRIENAFTGQWQVIGDPTADLRVAPDQNFNLVATGHFQMVFNYPEDGVTGPRHEPSGGGYSAQLSLTPNDITVSSIKAATGLAGMARPAAATDQAAETIVSAALKTCAGVHVAVEGGCPQSFFWPDSSDFNWTLVTDPLMDATVSFDAGTGIYTVHGDFEMRLDYRLRAAQVTTYSNSTVYDAYLYWDGKQLVLVTIDGE